VNYTWQILRFNLNDELNHEGTLLENSIVNIKWKRVATDTDGTSASYVGNTKLSAANTAADDFIALNTVTKDTAIGWIEANLGSDEINRINSQLDYKIERNRVRQVKPSF